VYSHGLNWVPFFFLALSRFNRLKAVQPPKAPTPITAIWPLYRLECFIDSDEISREINRQDKAYSNQSEGNFEQEYKNSFRQ